MHLPKFSLAFILKLPLNTPYPYNNYLLLPTVATGSFVFCVTMTTRELLHLARWNFARTCTLATTQNLL